ncbi:glycosyltransferase family 4 protein [Clostridium pasteurianum]|uniref:Glycosyltransferase n=1 Tax=Clostridium pasteurianum BC1 TaxID=86416 RepID=R4K5R5_CLOPA|nr:glycosyltransferase family 4 protein [Clostridium pasteurianum]AGK95884.1 glycosyltransferase [Clostridium pasteurianum BC1]
MKICFIMTNIFSLGGVQRVVSVLSNELIKKNEIDILCISEKPKGNNDLYNLALGINVEFNYSLVKTDIFSKVFRKIIKNINMKTGILNNEYYYKKLINVYFPNKVRENFVKYFNKKQYDIIIGVEGLFSILLGSIKEELNSKVLGWQHNSYDAYLKNPNRYFWNLDVLFNKYICKLDKYIVLTNYDKVMYKNEKNIESDVIYNPLSFESNEKSTCSKKNVLFVGRLVEQQKGLDLLIQAFNRVCLKNKDWILKIVGDGPDKEKLEQLIENLKLSERIKIEPSTSNIQEYYLNSSIFVSSSRWEGFGLVITEAMECGLPVVAFDNSGPREIINKNYENGILVPCEDVDSLANAILDLINNEEKRKKISELAINRAKDFSINKISSDWNNIFNLLI